MTTTPTPLEKIIDRGDLSGLSPADRGEYYLAVCERLGLDPSTLPLAILRLNGKEVLYPTRGATDQLAAMHRLNREIVDGPKVVDVAGTKMIYAVCKATHPNGRVETAVATVPIVDPINALMKCETKAKRRATLSILGLGMLDETELETIPRAVSVELDPAHLPRPAPSLPAAPAPAPLAPLALTSGPAPSAPARAAPSSNSARRIAKIAVMSAAALAADFAKIIRLVDPEIERAHVARWHALLSNDSVENVTLWLGLATHGEPWTRLAAAVVELAEQVSQ